MSDATDPSELPAGRLLDAALGELVMGWKHIREHPAGYWAGRDPHGNPLSLLHAELPCWSTERDRLWEVVARMDHYFFHSFTLGKYGRWQASFRDRTDEGAPFFAWGDTPQEATARAAVLARWVARVMSEHDEEDDDAPNADA